MAYNVAIEPKPGYLHITITGDNTPETLAAYLRDVYAACQRTGCPLALIEEDLVGPSLTIIDVFEVIAERAAGVSPVVQTVAFVDRNPNHNARVNKFGETVAVNRGVHVRVFTDIAQAEQWIGSQVASSS
jgi:hypothetical protein